MAKPPPDQPLLVALEWIPAHCVIPDRHRAGEPFELYDYQFRFFANHYLVKGTALWHPEDPVLGPAFRFRRSIMVGPQKIGKGPKTAAHCCLEGAGPALFAGWAGKDDGYACADHGCGCGWEYAYDLGEPMGMPWRTPLIQLTAFSEEQAGNVYDALKPMIELGPLGDVFPAIGEEFIRTPGGGRIDKVTSSAKSRLGQRLTFAPQDETGLWTKANKMESVADTQYRGLAGMGGRASLDTNAWSPADLSVAQREFESASKDIYRQFRQPPPKLRYRNKADRRKIHQVVYEDALRERGGHIDLDSIEAEAGPMAARDLAQAERFFGNKIVAGQGSWLEDGVWKAAARPSKHDPDGRLSVCIGFDGSDSNDWTGFRCETLDGWQFTPHYGPDWLPAWWNPADWGGSIPRQIVMAAFDEFCERYDVRRSYWDPRDWQSEIDSAALKHGEDRVIPWATYRVIPMHGALQRTVVDLTSGRLTHDGDRTTEAHVGNAIKIPKPGDRYIIGKRSERQKIDMAMSTVIVHEAASDARAAGWGTEPVQDNSVVVFR